MSTFGRVLAGAALVAIWMALAFWPARVAPRERDSTSSRKGHSVIGCLIFRRFFCPLWPCTEEDPVIQTLDQLARELQAVKIELERRSPHDTVSADSAPENPEAPPTDPQPRTSDKP